MGTETAQKLPTARQKRSKTSVQGGDRPTELLQLRSTKKNLISVSGSDQVTQLLQAGDNARLNK